MPAPPDQYTAEVRALDVNVFHAVNGWPEWLSPLMVFLSEATKGTPVRVVLVVLVILLLVRSSTRRTAFQLLLAFPLANEICDVLKHVGQMARPCNDLPDVVLRVERLTSFGTASAHSANMAAVAFVVVAMHGRWGLPWVVVALLTGLSRVYVGVHYPSQVLLGWFVGAFSGFLIVKTFEAYARMRQRRTQHGNETQQA